jgi:hypothetical protein
VLGRRLIHLGLAIEPVCSSLEPSGHRGRIAGAPKIQLGRALYGLLHLWTNPLGRDHQVGGGRDYVEYLEPFNPSKKMTR